MRQTVRFAVALALVACGSSPTDTTSFGSGASHRTPQNNPKTSAPSDPEAPSGSLGGNPPLPGDGTGADGCSDAAKLVYVISEENDLYSFAPDKLAFTKVGALSCNDGGDGSPNSMAVDRTGTAWVNYDNDTIFKVSTKDASCQATPFQPNQRGFSTYGMAFATLSVGATADALFVVRADDSGGSARLARLDVTTLALSPVGGFSGALTGIGGELTGTGDGRLFGFFSTKPDATLAQIDEGGGATSGDKDLPNIQADNDFAFSFWGGDFWFYTSDGNTPSAVTRLETSGGGSLVTAMADVGGFRIVGAGVSTCAPTAPPR